MKILITGATGSAAYYLAEYIKTKVDEPHKIIGIGRAAAPFRAYSQHLDEYKSVDLRWQSGLLNDVIKVIKPDIIFHLAAMANVRRSFDDPLLFSANNTEGTLNLLNAIARAEIAPRFILASTSEVYGYVPESYGMAFTELLPIRPVNPYAATKCNQENWAHYYSHQFKIPLVITRAFGYINPKRDDLVATAFAKQLVKCERGEQDTIYHGDLSPVRSFCDVRDIAEAYWLAASAAPGTYNIGSELPMTIEGIVGILKALSTAKPKWVKEEKLLRPTDIFWAVPDCTLFRSRTGWSPKITLIESLEWLMEECRK